MEYSGNIPIFNIPGTLFWEYSPEFHKELFPNIPTIYHGIVPRIFDQHIYAPWVDLKKLRYIIKKPYQFIAESGVYWNSIL